MSCSLGSLRVELPGQCKVMLILNISTLLHQATGIRMLYGNLKCEDNLVDDEGNLKDLGIKHFS